MHTVHQFFILITFEIVCGNPSSNMNSSIGLTALGTVLISPIPGRSCVSS